MGRIIKVRSGRSIPAQDMGAIFRMTKLAQPVKTAEAAEACKLLVDDLFWQNGDTGEFDIKPDITEYVEKDCYSYISGEPDGYWVKRYDTCVWDGTKWRTTGAGMQMSLVPLNDWYVGFRPTKLRIQFTRRIGERINVYLKDVVGNTIGSVVAAGSSDPQLPDIPLNFDVAGDIYSLNVYSIGLIREHYCAQIDFCVY